MPMDVREIERTLRDIRKKSGYGSIAAYTDAITYLRLQLDIADAKEDIAFLYHMIADQHSFYGHPGEKEKTLQEIIDLFPEATNSWISASCFYMYEHSDPEKAVNFAKIGLQVAEDTKCLVIHACNNLCRAAKLKGDYELMERTIMRLLSYKRPADSLDCAYECDFLKGIPEGRVSELLVRRLRALCGEAGRK